MSTRQHGDIFVSFGGLPTETNNSIEINVTNQRPVFPINSRLKVRVKNNGSVAHYNLTPLVSFDNEIYQTENIEALPPFGTYDFEISVPFSFLGRHTPANILITVADSEVSIPTFKSWVIIYNLLIIFLLAGAAILIVLVKLKKINLHAKFNFKPDSIPKR